MCEAVDRAERQNGERGPGSDNVFCNGPYCPVAAGGEQHIRCRQKCGRGRGFEFLGLNNIGSKFMTPPRECCLSLACKFAAVEAQSAPSALIDDRMNPHRLAAFGRYIPSTPHRPSTQHYVIAG